MRSAREDLVCADLIGSCVVSLHPCLWREGSLLLSLSLMAAHRGAAFLPCFEGWREAPFFPFVYDEVDSSWDWTGNGLGFWAEAHGRRRRNEVKRSFLGRDLIWRNTTCLRGFGPEVLKVL